MDHNLYHFLKNNKMSCLSPKQTVLRVEPRSSLLLPAQNQYNLPAICQPRHYLIKSLSKDNNSLSNIFAPEIRKKLAKDNQETYRKTTIYNIEFKKRPQLAGSKSKTLSYDDYVKHTSLDKSLAKPRKQNARWRISNFFNRQGSRASIDLSDSQGKLKTISVNSQMKDVAEQSLKMSLNGFSPKMTKLDLSKKQIEFLSKNLYRYQEYTTMDISAMQKKQQEQQKHNELIFNKDNIKKRNSQIRNRYTYRSKKIGEGEKFVKRGVTCTPWAFEDNPEELLDFS